MLDWALVDLKNCVRLWSVMNLEYSDRPGLLYHMPPSGVQCVLSEGGLLHRRSARSRCCP